MSSARSTVDHKCTASRTRTSLEKGVHEYIIDGYHSLKKTGVGNFLFSQKFKVGGYEWRLRVYPEGENDTDKDFIGAYIELMSQANRDVKSMFEIGMVDYVNGEKRRQFLLRKTDPVDWSKIRHLAAHGWSRGILTKTWEQTYVKNDCVTFYVQIDVIGKQVTESVTDDWASMIPVPESHFEPQFAKLLESEKHSDLQIIVGGDSGRTFKVHKAILSARSEYFDRMLGCLDSRESQQGVVHIDQIDPAVFQILLHYIYTSQLPDDAELDVTMCQHLLAAADRFMIDHLNALCQQKLCDNISVRHVGDILILADQYSAPKLKTVCIKFAKEHLAEVLDTPGFLDLSTAAPSVYVELLKAISGSSCSKRSLEDANSCAPTACAGQRRVRKRSL